jgi:hypothetical protein
MFRPGPRTADFSSEARILLPLNGSRATVRAQNDRSVILEPLSLGTTNIVFVDERSIAITNVGVLVYDAGTVRITYQDQPDCE